jgi:hypothetical protein
VIARGGGATGGGAGDRVVQNLDRIQNSSTAHACAFDRGKIDMAKNAIQYVIAELEAQAEWDSAD